MSFEVLAKQNLIDEEYHKSIEEGEAKVKTDTASGFINGISASMQKTTVVGNNNPALKSNNFNARRTGNTIDLTMRTTLF